MLFHNGNGARFEERSDNDKLSEEQLDKLALKVYKQVKESVPKESGIGIKTFGVITGIVIAVGGLVWTASKITTEKASAADVTQLDKSLSQIMIKLEFIAEDVVEVKKDINALEKILNNRK